MSTGIDPMQLASQGAQILVSEMVKSGWASFHEKVTKIFRRGSDTSRQLEMLDADRQELIEAPEAEIEALKTHLLNRWIVQLAAFLEQYPDARQDLLALVKNSASDADAKASRHTLTATNNTSSQVVQAGGDINSGGGNFTFTAPSNQED